jgi:ribosomal protein S18 acetylase RimI-like enzyme
MSLAIPDIQLACGSDAERIAVMSRDYIESGLVWSWVPARVLRAIHDRDTNVAVLRGSRALVGFGIMQYNDDRAHLALLAVAPGHRNHGLGGRILSWLEKPARVAGIRRINVEARADNPLAIEFYCRYGFEQTATVDGYYQGRVNAVRLTKLLSPLTE